LGARAPCRLAPHHTAARHIDDDLHLRTLFVVEPAREGEVANGSIPRWRKGAW
jgi:hypothetical protein